METKNRRFVLNLPEELEEEIQMTKERFFHDTSYSEMYRQLIRAGLETLKAKKERLLMVTPHIFLMRVYF